MQKKKANIILLLLWIFLTIVAFFPTIILNQSLYSRARLVIYGLMFFIFFINSSYNALAQAFFRRVFFVLILTIMMILVFIMVGFKVSWVDTVNIIIVFIAMCIGYTWKYNEDSLETITLIFGALCVALGVVTLLYFVGSVSLSEYMYLVDTKNMVGQIVASGAIGLTMISFSSKGKKWIKIPLLVMAIILTLYLRCRTAAVAYVLFAAYFIWKRYDYRYLLAFVAFLSVVFVFFSSSIISFFDDVFIGSTDITDMESLSAHRMHRNVDGIDFFVMHPIFGEMNAPSDLENIHNYVIRRLAAYGIFSFPFLLIYFVFFIKLIKQWLKADVSDINTVGLMMMIIPFFSSLLEPLSPFGPGLVQIVPFFFYGSYLRSKNNYLAG